MTFSKARILLVMVFVLVLSVVPVCEARPWWWAQFSIGDGTNTGNSGFERWHAFIAGSGNAATDTTFVCSYTWGTAGIGSIDGINTANSMGLNSHSAAGGVPDYLICDGTASAGLTNAQTLSDVNVTDVTEPAGGAIMHIKDIFVYNKGYNVSSANHTSGGWDSQHNNSIWFPWSAMSAGFRAKVDDQMREMAGGTFHDATQYAGGDIYYSPYGDTIELRYAPDDNDGGTGVGTGSILSRYRQLVASSRESILFMSDAWSASVGTDALRDDIIAKTGIIWRGCAGDPGAGDWDATTVTNFEGDANGTLRSQPGGFNQLHTKTFIFDLDIVATGSSNMTASAMYSAGSNDEVNIIVHDFRLARRYMSHYHHIMTNVGVTNDPSADAYDGTAPAGATGLGVTPTATAFNLNWTASATTDVSRYYLFIDTAALTQNGIGDRVDDDADGYYDEDPRGDYDSFPSGTAAPGSAADDDADGVNDEDLWMAPEVQVKGKASTSGTITSVNVGDSLVAGRNYYFAVVSVDTQGNEGAIATAGPFQLLGASQDTSIRVTLNSNVADTSIGRGETNVVALRLLVRGDTTQYDYLRILSVKHYGTADTRDFRNVRLWCDKNGDSRVSPGTDVNIDTLTYNSALAMWRTNNLAGKTDTGIRGDTGNNYLITIDFYDTATVGETVYFSVPQDSSYGNRCDSGPTSTITNNGTITIAYANVLTVTKTGDYASANIAQGATDSPVLRVNISFEPGGDTLIQFCIANLGNMVSGTDVAALRLYRDNNFDSKITAADSLVATLVYSSARSRYEDTDINFTIATDSANFIVALTTNAGATELSTFQAQVPASSVKTTRQDTGPSASLSGTGTLTIPSSAGADTQVCLNEYLQNSGTQDHNNNGSSLDGDEEFVELFNRGPNSVNVGGWDFGDNSPGDYTIVDSPVIMPAYAFLIIYTESSTPTLPRALGRYWTMYDSLGVVLDTGACTGVFGTAGIFNNSADSVIIRNASDVQIDSQSYLVDIVGWGRGRIWDGASTWATRRITPGYNQDPTAAFNCPSPNAHLNVTATPSTFVIGDTTLLTLAAREPGDTVIAAFTGNADIWLSAGSVSPNGSGAFVAGAKTVSVTISNTTGTTVIWVAYATTTYGTVAVNVLPVPPLTVVNAGTISNRSIFPNDTGVVAQFVRVTGRPAGDTLTKFTVVNTGSMDSTDVSRVMLWEDDGDSTLDGGDTRVAQLYWNSSAGGWDTTNISYSLGDSTACFLVTIDVAATVTLGETFNARIPAYGLDVSRYESGPVAAVTSAGTLTVAQRVLVSNAGITANVTAYAGDTNVVLQFVRVTGAGASDTLTRFAIANLGSMDSTDVSRILVWEDNGDSAFGTGDTRAAQLYWNASAGAWDTATVSYSLGGDVTACFFITLDIAATATLGDTFNARVPALSVKTTRSDTGPVTAVASAGTVTIAQRVLVGNASALTNTTAYASDTNVVLQFIRVTGAGASDTLTRFAIANPGNMDSTDVSRILIWEDNGDSAFGAGDTRAAQLYWNAAASAWDTATVSYFLGGDATACFFITLDISATAATGDTFNARVPALSVKTSRGDTGPLTAVASAGTITIAQRVFVSNAGTATSATAYTGDTNVVLQFVRVTGAGGSDTLTRFAVANLGSMDSTDVSRIMIWEDNGDSAFGAGDTRAAQLYWNAGAGAWDTAPVSYSLGGDVTACFFVTLDISATATLGDTFNARVPALSVKTSRGDTGPLTAVASAGTITIAQRVLVSNAGTATSATAYTGDTNVVLQFIRVTGAGASDTLTRFAIANPGNMDSTDVSRILVWEDNGDSAFGAGDTRAAQLYWNASAGAWDTATVSYFLGGDVTACFFVTLDISATAATGDTFNARVPALSVKTTRGDTGPITAVASAGTITIAQRVFVSNAGTATSATAYTGDTNVVLQFVRVTGAGASDTLTRFAVANLGNMDSTDVSRIMIWEDNGDSAFGAGDTRAAQLYWNASAGAWDTATVSYSLGGDVTACFFVTLDISATATLGDTFNARVPALSVKTSRGDTGPLTAVDSAGTVTIAQRVLVGNASALTNTTAYAGDTNVVLQFIRVTGAGASDTLTRFAIANPGNMDSTDVSRILIWEDNGDSAFGAGDTRAAQLYWNAAASAWDTATVSYFLGGDATACFFIALDISATVTPGDTFNARVPALSVKTTRGDTGPITAVASAGTVTIAQRVLVGNASALTNTTAYASDTNVVLQFIRVTGAGASDTLTRFAIANLGNMDSTDVSCIIIWEDNGDSAFGAGDTRAAQLYWNAAASAWDTATVSYFLGGDVTAGFFVTLDISATATLGDTFNARVPALSVKTTRGDTGPITAVNSAGIVTVRNQLSITLATTIANAVKEPGTVNITVLALAISGANGAGGDTLVSFALQNLGNARSDSDIAAVKLWRDANLNNLWDSGDTLVAILDNAGDTWYRNNIPFADSSVLTISDSRFVVTIDIKDTPVLGDTFQARVNAYTVMAARADSGPLSSVTNGGVITIAWFTYTLSGTAPLQADTNCSGTTLRLYNSSDVNIDTRLISNSSGTYAFSGLANGTYYIVARKDGYLSQRITGLTISGSDSAGTILPPLPAGDIVIDNQINILDAAYLRGHWNTTDPRADLTKNGIVNEADMQYIRQNFGRQGTL